jgi:hypothetical protein
MDKIVQFNENCHPVFCEDLVETYSKKTHQLVYNIPLTVTDSDDDDWSLFKDDIMVNIMNKIDIYKDILRENIDIKIKDEYEPNIIQLGHFDKGPFELRELFVCRFDPSGGGGGSETVLYNFFKRNPASVMSFCIILNDVDAGGTLLVDNTVVVPTHCGDLFFFPAGMDYQYKFPTNMPQYVLLGEIVYTNVKGLSCVNYVQ